MSKHWMRELSVACSKAVALSALGIGMARAAGLETDQASTASYGVPADFSLLIWLPLLLLTFACVGGLLWLIWSDAKPRRLKALQTTRRRRLKLAPTVRMALLHR